MKKLAILAVIFPLLGMGSAPEVRTGMCTPIRPNSAFLDPIVSRDPTMRYWDPIVFPGVYGYFASQRPGFPQGDLPYSTGTHGPAHWHTFFGNRSLSPNGISDPDYPTTCTGGFKGAFWTPSLIAYTAVFPGGVRLDPQLVTYRLKAPGTQVSFASTWDCGPGTLKGLVPLTCRTGSVQAVVRFPALGRIRVDFKVTTEALGEPIEHLSVGGVPIAVGTAGFPEFGPPFREDEHSMHADVMSP